MWKCVMPSRSNQHCFCMSGAMPLCILRLPSADNNTEQRGAQIGRRKVAEWTFLCFFYIFEIRNLY
jgi:hypothetical protein